jgi:hypothetical protein
MTQPVSPIDKWDSPTRKPRSVFLLMSGRNTVTRCNQQDLAKNLFSCGAGDRIWKAGKTGLSFFDVVCPVGESEVRVGLGCSSRRRVTTKVNSDWKVVIVKFNVCSSDSRNSKVGRNEGDIRRVGIPLIWQAGRSVRI